MLRECQTIKIDDALSPEVDDALLIVPRGEHKGDLRVQGAMQKLPRVQEECSVLPGAASAPRPHGEPGRGKEKVWILKDRDGVTWPRGFLQLPMRLHRPHDTSHHQHPLLLLSALIKTLLIAIDWLCRTC